MAKGDITLFSDVFVAIGTGLIDLETAPLKVALSSATIASLPKTTADPRFGIGGGTNLSTNEVSGTNYAAGGNPAANPTFTETGDVVTYDADNPATWARHASGPTDIRTAIIYIDDANDYAIGAMDLTNDGTTPLSLADGDIAVSFGAAGIFTMTN